ncbi:50S ribosomal protein L44e [Candidatus Woesearchaeota archaeon]|nr:50S ribosomal protein L44e [Candidatus Woesearchaeota archaeon]
MKLPKLVKRLCPYCKKHTEHKVSQAKKRTPGSSRPLAKSAKCRTGFGKGFGNLGRYGSRPPIGNFKMTGKKVSKKTDLRYECKECKKLHTQKKGFRAKRVEFK